MAMLFIFSLVENLPPKLIIVLQGFVGTRKLDVNFKNQNYLAGCTFLLCCDF